MDDGDGNPNCALLHTGRMGRNRMSGLDYGPLHSRIKGRVSIERSLRALVLRCHRLGNGRALSDADKRWLARVLDKLTDALDRSHAQEMKR